MKAIICSLAILITGSAAGFSHEKAEPVLYPEDSNTAASGIKIVLPCVINYGMGKWYNNCDTCMTGVITYGASQLTELSILPYSTGHCTVCGGNYRIIAEHECR